MPRQARPVALPDDELRSLTVLAGRGSTPARIRARARIPLLLHRGRTHDEVIEALGVAITTVYNVKRRYLRRGFSPRPCMISPAGARLITRRSGSYPHTDAGGENN